MSRFLIIAGLVLLLAGLVWPLIAKLGLGRLPGDFTWQRGNTRVYFPLMSSLILSAVLSLLLYLFRR